MEKKSAARKIQTGEWNGEPIWRYETAADRMAAEIAKDKKPIENPNSEKHELD